jgi:hypothetical protein
MPSNGIRSTLIERATSTRSLIILTAIAVAIPTAYAFQGQFPGTESGFLLLFAVAVGVPSAFDGYGPTFESRRNCVFATLWVCSAVVVAYVGCFVAGIDVFDLSPFLASVLSFLVGFFGPIGVLATVAT